MSLLKFIAILCLFYIPSSFGATLLLLERSANLAFTAELADYLNMHKTPEDKVVVSYIDTSLLSLILDAPSTDDEEKFTLAKQYAYDYVLSLIQREIDASGLESRIDTIVAQGTPAAKALDGYPYLLPNAKRYFLHINWQPNTGILIPSDFDARISTQQILDLFPATTQIALIYNPLTWSNSLASSFYALKREFPQITFSLLNPTWSFKKVTETMQKMHGAIALLAIESLDAMLLNNISLSSNAVNQYPVFAIFPPASSDQNILGGMVVSPKKLAKTILKLIRKERLTPGVNQGLQAVFNHNVLDRYGITSSDLPADAVILNRPVYTVETIYQIFSGCLVLVVMLLGFHVYKVRQKQGLLEKRTREAELANQNKDTFLANMSHELRTPLNGIYGAFQVLLQHDVPREKIIRTGMRSTEALTNILSDILDAQKIKEGKLALNLEWMSTSKMIDQLYHLYKSVADSKGLDFEIVCDESMPDELYCDATRLGQIFHNLVGNAFKFTHQGSVLIEYQYVNHQLMVDVADTGIGIKKEVIDQLFERFTQGDSKTTKLYGGSGLGLAITKSLLEIMGGKIDVSSIFEQGTRFSITLPLDGRKHHRPEVRIEPTVKNYGLCILIVDDDPISRMLAVHLIKPLYNKVLAAENGRQALIILEQETVDVVLTDIHMPVMDGMELQATLRATDPELPVIALTGTDYANGATDLFDRGFSGFVGKPFAKDAIIVARNEMPMLSSPTKNSKSQTFKSYGP